MGGVGEGGETSFKWNLRTLTHLLHSTPAQELDASVCFKWRNPVARGCDNPTSCESPASFASSVDLQKCAVLRGFLSLCVH